MMFRNELRGCGPLPHSSPSYCVSGVDTLDRWVTHVPGGQSSPVRDFITLLRRARNLRRMDCLFLEFSIYSFWAMVKCR